MQSIATGMEGGAKILKRGLKSAGKAAGEAGKVFERGAAGAQDYGEMVPNSAVSDAFADASGAAEKGVAASKAGKKLDRKRDRKRNPKLEIVDEENGGEVVDQAYSIPDAKKKLSDLLGKNVSLYQTRMASSRGDLIEGVYSLRRLGKKRASKASQQPIPKGKRKLKIRSRRKEVARELKGVAPVSDFSKGHIGATAMDVARVATGNASMADTAELRGGNLDQGAHDMLKRTMEADVERWKQRALALSDLTEKQGMQLKQNQQLLEAALRGSISGDNGSMHVSELAESPMTMNTPSSQKTKDPAGAAGSTMTPSPETKALAEAVGGLPTAVAATEQKQKQRGRDEPETKSSQDLSSAQELFPETRGDQPGTEASKFFTAEFQDNPPPQPEKGLPKGELTELLTAAREHQTEKLKDAIRRGFVAVRQKQPAQEQEAEVQEEVDAALSDIQKQAEDKPTDEERQQFLESMETEPLGSTTGGTQSQEVKAGILEGINKLVTDVASGTMEALGIQEGQEAPPPAEGTTIPATTQPAQGAAAEEEGDQGGRGRLRYRGMGYHGKGSKRVYMGGRMMYKRHQQKGGTVYRSEEVQDNPETPLDEDALNDLREEAQGELDRCRPKAGLKLRAEEEKFTPEELKAQQQEDKAQQAAVLAQEELDAIEDEAADAEQGEEVAGGTPGDGVTPGDRETPGEEGTPGDGGTPVQTTTPLTEAKAVEMGVNKVLTMTQAQDKAQHYKHPIYNGIKAQLNNDVWKISIGQEPVNFSYEKEGEVNLDPAVRQLRATQIKNYFADNEEAIKARIEDVVTKWIHLGGYHTAWQLFDGTMAATWNENKDDLPSPLSLLMQGGTKLRMVFDSLDEPQTFLINPRYGSLRLISNREGEKHFIVEDLAPIPAMHIDDEHYLTREEVASVFTDEVITNCAALCVNKLVKMKKRAIGTGTNNWTNLMTLTNVAGEGAASYLESTEYKIAMGETPYTMGQEDDYENYWQMLVEFYKKNRNQTIRVRTGHGRDPRTNISEIRGGRGAFEARIKDHLHAYLYALSSRTREANPAFTIVSTVKQAMDLFRDGNGVRWANMPNNMQWFFSGESGGVQYRTQLQFDSDRLGAWHATYMRLDQPFRGNINNTAENNPLFVGPIYLPAQSVSMPPNFLQPRADTDDPGYNSFSVSGSGSMVGGGLLDTAGMAYPQNVPYVQTSEDLEDEYAQLTYERKRKLRFGMKEDGPNKMQRTFQFRNVRRPAWDKGKRIVPDGGRAVSSLYRPPASTKSVNLNGLPTLPAPPQLKQFDVNYDRNGFQLVERVPRTREGVAVRQPLRLQAGVDRNPFEAGSVQFETPEQARERAPGRAQAAADAARAEFMGELPGDPGEAREFEGAREAPEDPYLRDTMRQSMREAAEEARDRELLRQIQADPEISYPADAFTDIDPLRLTPQSDFGGSGNPRMQRLQMRNHKNFRNYGGRGMARKGAGYNLMN